MALSKEQDQRLSQLMKKAQDGDAVAYTLLLKDVYSLLQGFIQNRLGETSAWEDVIQEILISVHRARHTFNPDKPFAPWMFAIARFRMADYWRRTFRRMEDAVTDEIAASAAEPGEPVTDLSLHTKLARALERLPEKQRHAINLLKVEGLTLQDAARKMNVSVAALKVTAHRAYKALRQQFEELNEHA